MKKSVLIAGIIISLALIGGGVFWYVKNQNIQPVNNPPITNNRQEQTATSTKENDTSNWQTYRNEEYGFEFKYPSDLLESKSDYYTIVLSNDSANINIEVLTEELNPDTIKSPIGIVTKESLEKIMVGGKRSYRFRDGDMGYGGNSYRIPLDTGHSLVLWFVTEGGYYNNEDKIISTFKFVK